MKNIFKKMNKILNFEKFQITISHGCNARCKYCDNYKNKLKFLTYKEFTDVINKLLFLGCKEIKIWGDEPFLNPDIIEMINYSKKKGLKIILPTNATLLSNKILNKIKNKVDEFQISYDSIDEVKFQKLRGYKKQKVEEAIIRINKLSPKSKININVLISKDNYFEVLDIVNKLNQYFNITQFSFLEMHDLSKSCVKGKLCKKEYEYFLNEYNKINKKIKKDLCFYGEENDLRSKSLKLKEEISFFIDINKKIFIRNSQNRVYLGKLSESSILKEIIKLRSYFNKYCREYSKYNSFQELSSLSNEKISLQKNEEKYFTYSNSKIKFYYMLKFYDLLFSKALSESKILRFCKLKIKSYSEVFLIFEVINNLNLSDYLLYMKSNRINFKNIRKYKSDKNKCFFSFELKTNILLSLVFSIIEKTEEFENKFFKKYDAMIEPVNSCNLKCLTCYAKDMKESKFLTLSKFQEILDKNSYLINSLALYNYGEPFINKNLDSMVEYAKKKGIQKIKIATNGHFYNKKVFEKILSSNLVYLSISLDGISSETYSKFRKGGNFNLVVSNINKIVGLRNRIKSKSKIEIQFIIMSHNEHEIIGLKNFCKSLGVDFLRLKTVLIKEKKWSMLLPSNKYNRYNFERDPDKDLICLKPENSFVVNSDGKFLPCCYIVGEQCLKNNEDYGNIYKNSVYEILTSVKYDNFLNNCLINRNLNKDCLKCEENSSILDYKIIKF